MKNYKIYVGGTSRCFICLKKNNVKQVKQQTITQYLLQHKIMLKPSCVICKNGNCNNKLIPQQRLQIYQPSINKKHKLGQCYIRILHQKLNKLSKSVNGPTTNLKKTIKTLTNKIKKLQQQIHNTEINNNNKKKHTIIDITDEKTFQRETKRLKESYNEYCLEDEDENKLKRSNRNINRVAFEKLSNGDCKGFCRNTRKQLEEISKESKISQEALFIFFTRLFRYISYRMFSLIFGYSKSKLQDIFIKTTIQLFNRWAKIMLLLIMIVIINIGQEIEYGNIQLNIQKNY